MKRCDAFLADARSTPVLISLAAMQAWSDDGSRRPYEMYDGIACIDVMGPLGDKWYCQTSYEDLQDELAQALADSSVRGIMLRVNSPGGFTDNAFETAAAIGAAAKLKPMCAVVTGMAYSGGYLLASQAGKIYLEPAITGGVGSIGVYCGHVDYSGALEQAGVKVTLISAGEGKVDGNPYEPLSADAKARMEADVQRLYGEFTGAVARGRGMTMEAVVKLGAHLYDGAQQALASGLIDQAGKCEDAISALVQEASAGKFSARAGEKGKKQMAEVDDKAAVTEARAAGFADAQEIAELCTVAGKPGKVAEFLQGKKTAAEVRTALLAERAAEAGANLDLTVSPGEDTTGADGKGAGKGHGKASAWGAVLEKVGLKKKEVK